MDKNSGETVTVTGTMTNRVDGLRDPSFTIEPGICNDPVVKDEAWVN